MAVVVPVAGRAVVAEAAVVVAGRAAVVAPAGFGTCDAHAAAQARAEVVAAAIAQTVRARPGLAVGVSVADREAVTEAALLLALGPGVAETAAFAREGIADGVPATGVGGA